MIYSLTAEHRARFPEFVGKWTKIVLSTEPVNRPKAEKVIRNVYACAGLKLPNRVVWFGSNHEMCDYAKLLADYHHKHPVGCHGLEPVYYSVWAGIRASVQVPVNEFVRDKVRSFIRGPVRDAVWNSILFNVCDSAWGNVVGPHETVWLAAYDYYRQVLGLKKETDQFDGLFEWAHTCGWIYPMKEVCLASERTQR